MRVTVHLELYDGLPLLCQWLEVHNDGAAPVLLDTFTSVLLAVVSEHEPDLAVVDVRMPPDYEDEGMRAAAAIRHSHPEWIVKLWWDWIGPDSTRALLTAAR